MKLDKAGKNMTIDKKLNKTELTISLEGRLDTIMAPQLETELKDSFNVITSLVLDFSRLDYISSAGLRVLLSAQKVMNKQGKMCIQNVNKTIQEVFDVTGFSDILTIK
ncbi:MAG: STAS domain-containing protein [Christensenella sp.]|nr:STAS domain-containing protein [Christensenella sp.]